MASDINSEGITVLLGTHELNAVAPLPLGNKTYRPRSCCSARHYSAGGRLTAPFTADAQRTGISPCDSVLVQNTLPRKGTEQDKTRI